MLQRMSDEDEAPAIQVDALADALDVLDEDSTSSALPPALPPPLPPKKRRFPIVLALVVAAVAIGAGLLVGQFITPASPDVPPAPTTPGDDVVPAEPAEAPPRIDLGPILVEASHDAGSGALEEAPTDHPSPER